MTTWIPQPDESLPTTRIRLGYTDINSNPPFVRLIKINGKRAIFESEINDDRGLSSKNFDGDFYHHPQVSELYSQLDPRSRYEVEPIAHHAEIPTAEAVGINIQRGDEDIIKSFLKDKNTLVHPNALEIFPTEETPADQNVFEINIHQCTPSEHTLRVTSSTEINVLEPGHQQQDVSGNTNVDRGSENNNENDDDDVWEYLENQTPERSFDQVVGVEDGQKKVRKLSRVLIPDIREKLEETHGEDVVKKGSSLLMYGPPGCGKSLTAEAIAYGLKHRCLTCNTLNCNTHQDTLENRLGKVQFLEVEGQAISSKFKGEASDRFDTVFEKVYELAEGDGFVVLFFDEAQVLLSDNADAESDTDAEVTNTFLRRTEGNEIESKNILIIGATNYPYQIDKAALDRFKFEIFVGPPKRSNELAELWREFTSGQQNTDQLDYDSLGEASVGFAPRELRNLQIQRVDQTYSGKEFDPDNLESLTHDDYLEYIEESDPKTIKRYLGELSNNRRKLSGWQKLEEFYEQWKPFFNDMNNADGVDTANTDAGDERSSAIGAGDSSNTKM